MPCQSGRRVAAAILAVVPLAGSAGPVSWAHQDGSLSSNGAVTIKSLAGGSYSGTVNPMGAVAKANQSAVTQPPTVIVQATASLPIKVVGDACATSTSGGAPNESAGEGTAILADRSSLLTCQAGAWTRASSSGILTTMHLNGSQGQLPLACPTTWIQLNYAVTGSDPDVGAHYSRTCLAPSTKTCSAVELLGTQSYQPAACPALWMQANYGSVGYDSWYGMHFARACYICL